MSRLASFPEEILEQILDESLNTTGSRVQKFHPNNSRPSASSALLTCRSFNRIATPLLYHSIHLKSAAQTDSLLQSLSQSPTSGSSVRFLTADGMYPNLGQVMQYFSGLQSLDFCLDNLGCQSRRPNCVSPGPGGFRPQTPAGGFRPQTPAGGFRPQTPAGNYRPQTPGGFRPQTPANVVYDPTEAQLHAFCNALGTTMFIRSLTIRKSAQVYLTNPLVRLVFERLAVFIRNWTSLETVYIAFRMSDDSQNQRLGMYHPSAPPHVPGALHKLTSSLAMLSNFRTFTTHLPSVWNNLLVNLTGESPDLPPGYSVASASLERIILLPGSGHDAGGVPTGNIYAPPIAYASSTPPERPNTPQSILHRNRSLNSGPRKGPVRYPAHMGASAAPPILCEESISEPGGLYLAEAKKYPRLMQLIKNGWAAQADRQDSGRFQGSDAPSFSAAGRNRACTWTSANGGNNGGY